MDLPPSYPSLLDHELNRQQTHIDIPMAAGGPQYLPPLVKGQKFTSGPFIVTVTDSMVEMRNRQNKEIYQAWLDQQRRDLRSLSENEYFAEFQQSKIRRKFIRKVFFILFLQFLFTTIYVAFFVLYEPAKIFINKYWYLWLIAMSVFLCSYCSISITDCGRRATGWGITCLLLLTLAESHLAAYVSVQFENEMILITVGVTTTVMIIVSLTATFSKFDFTMWVGLLSIFGIISVFGLLILLIVILYTNIPILYSIFGIIGALIFSMYLYFDIQTLMGGRKIEISPNEIIFATTQLYVDIIGLYRYLLILIGGLSRS